MAKLLLIVCAIFACGLLPVYAQTPAPGSPSSSSAPATAPVVPAGATTTPGDGPTPPPARLIKPRTTAHTEIHPTDHSVHQHPLDDRCRPLKDQLELALQKPGNQHRLFQARVAHNAGARLCREGHADKGIAEMQRGLSYLQETPH
jgi:hypothetical protein